MAQAPDPFLCPVQDFDALNGHQTGLAAGCRLEAAADPHAAIQARLNGSPLALAIDAADAALMAWAAHFKAQGI